MANNALAGGGVGVGVQEAAKLGVVVAGLEVVQTGIGVIVVGAVAQGVVCTEGACQGAGGVMGASVYGDSMIINQQAYYVNRAQYCL